jgi:hypothetical protein
MMLIYGNKELWESFTPEQAKEVIAQQDAFNNRYFESGELLGAYGLGYADQARMVRVENGMPVVTDGPYLESKEHMASAYILDVASAERAQEIAAEMPAAPLRGVEIWPILHEANP